MFLYIIVKWDLVPIQFLLDFVDRSGMEFFYSRQVPTHLAGGISLGYPVLPDLVVPPGADNFVVQAICSAECLERVSELYSFNFVFDIALFSFSLMRESLYLDPSYTLTWLVSAKH